jgi:hypothetical protein
MQFLFQFDFETVTGARRYIEANTEYWILARHMSVKVMRGRDEDEREDSMAEYRVLWVCTYFTGSIILVLALHKVSKAKFKPPRVILWV